MRAGVTRLSVNGLRTGHHADSPTRFHAPARQVRRMRGADRPGPQGVRHALTRWAEALLADRSPPQRHCRRPTPWTASARGSFDGLQKAVHLLSLLAHDRACTGAAAVPNGGEDKTNEHKAALRLLGVWSSKGVWSPAMPFCRAISAGGDRCGGRLPGVRQRQPTDAPE